MTLPLRFDRRWFYALAALLLIGVVSGVVYVRYFNEKDEGEGGLYGFLERPRVVPDAQPTPGFDAVATSVVEQAAQANLHFDQPEGELWWDGPPDPKKARWRLTAAIGVDPDRPAPVDPDRAPADSDKAGSTSGEPDAGIDPELLPGAFIEPQEVFSLSDGRCDPVPELRQRYGIPQMIAVEDARWFFPVRTVLRDASWFNTGFSHDGWELFQADDPDQTFLVYGPDPNFAIEYRTFICPAPA